MIQDEIIEMARQHNIPVELTAHPAVKKLVHEVAKKVEARYMQLFLDPENQPTQFGTATQEYREQEIKAEREACAKLIEDYKYWLGRTAKEDIASAIRARGEA